MPCWAEPAPFTLSDLTAGCEMADRLKATRSMAVFTPQTLADLLQKTSPTLYLPVSATGSLSTCESPSAPLPKPPISPFSAPWPLSWLLLLKRAEAPLPQGHVQTSGLTLMPAGLCTPLSPRSILKAYLAHLLQKVFLVPWQEGSLLPSSLLWGTCLPLPPKCGPREQSPGPRPWARPPILVILCSENYPHIGFM